MHGLKGGRSVRRKRGSGAATAAAAAGGGRSSLNPSKVLLSKREEDEHFLSAVSMRIRPIKTRIGLRFPFKFYCDTAACMFE